jgi:hypothetical protein
MALDTAAKRAAAAHVKRLGKGVTPDATEPLIWRAAVGWNYLTSAALPPVGGGEADRVRIGVVEGLGVNISPAIGGWSSLG